MRRADVVDCPSRARGHRAGAGHDPGPPDRRLGGIAPCRNQPQSSLGANAMSSTPRLAMPFLSAGQAQKEISHNEALQTLDMLVAAAVEEPPRAVPPASPTVGTCYIVAAAPTGAWAGKQQCVAAYTSGGWRFIDPVEGMAAYVKSDSAWAAYRAGVWEIGSIRGFETDHCRSAGRRQPCRFDRVPVRRKHGRYSSSRDDRSNAHRAAAARIDRNVEKQNKHKSLL